MLFRFCYAGQPPVTHDEPIERALQYVEQLESTHYGWWTGGPIPAGPPAWALDALPPAVSDVRNSSCFCAGIPNLMLRVVGGSIPCLDLPTPDPECGQCCGGTGAAGRNFSSVATPFDLDTNYSRGTLLGRPYRSVHDQGHVAILLGSGRTGKLLQSYSDCRRRAVPDRCTRRHEQAHARASVPQAQLLPLHLRGGA